MPNEQKSDLQAVLDHAAQLRAAAKTVGACGWGTSVSESEHFSRIAAMDWMRGVLEQIDEAERELLNRVPAVNPAQPDSGEWLDQLEAILRHSSLRAEKYEKLLGDAPRLIAIARAAALMADALSMYVDEDDPFRGDVAALATYKEATK